MKKGILTGVGVGPGDPELVTLKAINCIKSADVVILPGKSREDCRAYDIIKDFADVDGKELLFKPFPMVMNKEALDEFHEQVTELVRVRLDRDESIAFITIGDPTIYSTFSYINSRIQEEGYRTQIVSGVSSVNAVAGRLGISIADGNEEVHIIPGSADLKETLGYRGTKIYMKSGRKLAELLELLKEDESAGRISVMAVCNCGMETERIYRSLSEIPCDEKYLMTVIVKEK